MNKTRLNYMLDAVIALAFLLASVSGIAFLFMGSGGYQGGRNAAFARTWLGLARDTWDDLHTWTALIMIVGVVLHIILHWKWIVCVTRDLLKSMREARAKAEACPVLE